MEIFNTPIYKFIFDNHLAETLVVLGVIYRALIILKKKVVIHVRSRSLSLSLKEKINEATKNYITPDFSKNDPGHYDEPSEIEGRKRNIIKYIDSIVEGRIRSTRIFVLGDSGMGKTSLLYNIYFYYLRKLKKRRCRLVELGTSNSFDEIKKINEPENTVLLLDALDENVEMYTNMEKTMEDISLITRNFYRVIITCRTQFFSRADGFPELITNIGGVASAGDYLKGKYIKIYLCPLTNIQVYRFLINKYIFTPQNISLSCFIKSVKIVKKIPNISVRPMLLTYVDYLISEEINDKYTYSLYEAMIYGWLARRKSRALDPELSMNLIFVYILAIYMARNYLINGGFYCGKEEAENIARKIGSSLTSWQISDRSLLNIDSKGNYKFAHMSILEVLLARADLNKHSLGKLKLSEQASFFKEEMVKRLVEEKISDVNIAVPMKVLDIKSEFDNLKNIKYNMDELFYDAEGKYAEVTSRGKSIDRDFDFYDMRDVELNNSNLSGISFCGSDFSGMKVDGSAFEDCDFTGSNFTGSKFVNCVFKGAKILGANLTGAFFVDCDMRNVDLSMITVDKNNNKYVVSFIGSDLTGSIVPYDYKEYFVDFDADRVSIDSEKIKK